MIRQVGLLFLRSFSKTENWLGQIIAQRRLFYSSAPSNQDDLTLPFGPPMQIDFLPLPAFTTSIQENLKEMTKRAFAACKLQFSSSEDHAMPHCQFHMGGDHGNTGNLNSIHLTFSDQQHLSTLALQNPAELEQLIHHEMVHFFQSQLHGTEPFNYLPTWFHEGMAVAFSGQCLIARNSHLDEDFEAFGGNEVWEDFYLMNEYMDGLNCNESPFDVLYGSWGALFIYAVSEQPSIFPKHAVIGIDTFLHAQVGPTECANALAIIDTAKKLGFNAALKKHTGKEQISESEFRKFLAPD